VNRVTPLVETPTVVLTRFDHPAGVAHSDPREEMGRGHGVNFRRSRRVYDMGKPSGQQAMRGRYTEIFVRRDGRWIHPVWHLDSAQ
jgi:hypothetical protein